MLPTLYRGSVKDLLGPIGIRSGIESTESAGRAVSNAIVFDYTDAFSVFDWGRMPDLLPKKGEALAVLAADLFEKLEQPEAWREFSKTSEALSLRKANRFGSAFNELGEELQAAGLRTHYLGVLPNTASANGTRSNGSHEEFFKPQRLNSVTSSFRRIAVKPVSVVKPKVTSVLGRALPDYYPTLSAPPPRLIPLEVVFRMGCPAGSSLLERVKKDPDYLATIGFADFKIQEGMIWNFPILELFTKLESTDRLVSLSEGLAISGLSPSQLQEVLLKSAWVAGILRYWCSKAGLELLDGKLEWAISEKGQCFLVDAVGPDELRILKDGVQLSKEFLRAFYRTTPWYQSIEKAKLQAKNQGVSEWKRLMVDSPPALPIRYRELAVQVYLVLTNSLTGRRWFSDAWTLEKVLQELKAAREAYSV